MSHHTGLIVGWVLLVSGTAAFLLLFTLGLLRHFSWSRRVRRRIGWYS